MLFLIFTGKLIFIKGTSNTIPYLKIKTKFICWW